MFLKRDPKRFWDWFSRHENELFTLNDTTEHSILSKVSKQLFFYNPYLTFEMFNDLTDGKKEFLITAQGDAELFDSVFHIIDAAPNKLKQRWNFTALRQADMDDAVINLGEIKIGIKDIIYELEEAENLAGKYDLFIHIKGLNMHIDDVEEYCGEAIMIILDGVIGEFLTGTKINDVIFVEKEELDQPKNIIDLRKEIK